MILKDRVLQNKKHPSAKVSTWTLKSMAGKGALCALEVGRLQSHAQGISKLGVLEAGLGVRKRLETDARARLVRLVKGGTGALVFVSAPYRLRRIGGIVPLENLRLCSPIARMRASHFQRVFDVSLQGLRGQNRRDADRLLQMRRVATPELLLLNF